MSKERSNWQEGAATDWQGGNIDEPFKNKMQTDIKSVSGVKFSLQGRRVTELIK
jgi:hypothetical protein